jgi:hypothetical protein
MTAVVFDVRLAELLPARGLALTYREEGRLTLRDAGLYKVVAGETSPLTGGFVSAE